MNIKTNFVNDLNNKLNLNPNFDDIRNKINVFQYIKEENNNTSLLSLVKTNKTYKIAGLSALAVVLSLGVVLPIALSDYSGSDISGSEQPMKYPHIFDIYSVRQQNYFANFKVLEIEETLYYKKDNVDKKYLVVKCEVVEDFYKVLESNQIVYVPFEVYNVDFDIDLLHEWLLNLDSLCICSTIDYKSGNEEFDFSFWNNLIGEKDGSNLKVDIPLKSVSFDIVNTIPIYDGKVDVDTICDMSGGNFSGSWLLHSFIDNQYIKQGMDKDTLFENLRCLYYDQLEERNNNES